MRRKKFKRQRDRATTYLNWWCRALGLRWWRVEYNWHDDDSSAFCRDDGNVTVARAWAKWQYLHLVLDINTPALTDLDDEHLEETVVHEFCHALINEMREEDPDGKREERVVTTLAKAFIWVRDIARDEARGAGPDRDRIRDLLTTGLTGDYGAMRYSAERALALLSGAEAPEEPSE
jgi:hypothetical protein